MRKGVEEGSHRDSNLLASTLRTEVAFTVSSVAVGIAENDKPLSALSLPPTQFVMTSAYVM